MKNTFISFRSIALPPKQAVFPKCEEESGPCRELAVVVGARQRHPMRLLRLRVPPAVGEKRRKDLLADARRRGQTVSEETLRLAA